tara:strand:- start:15706 stop:16179 length:474 start_codon:yes stop_codon:yes gene_type:complete
MDTKSFVKILRKVIREEVGKAVKQALTEQTVNHNQVIEHGMNLAEIAENPMPRRPIAKKKKFSKNSMLNDILNETAATGDFASMMQGPAVSYEDDYPQMGPARTSTMVQPNQPMTGINGERVDTSKPEMAAVQKALTRDYSGLIKAMDKKNGKMGTR